MKYMGSKARIAKEIMPIILKDRKLGQTYWEPFAGALNTFSTCPDLFYKWNENTERKWINIASDNNLWLVSLFGLIRRNKLQSKEDLSNWFFLDITKERYDNARNAYNSIDKNLPEGLLAYQGVDFAYLSNEYLWVRVQATIGFIGYMGSYNGRFFDGGYSGKSHGRDYINESINNLCKDLSVLNRDYISELIYGDYQVVYNERLTRDKLEKAGWLPEMIIYCDPPYKNSKQYSGKSFDYDAFYQWCIDRHAEGHQVFISEYDMPTELGFKEIWSKEIKCNIHVEKSNRVEKLWTL